LALVETNDRHEVPIEAQKMEILGRLAGAVIHDLNNLLTVIQLNAGLIETDGLDREEILDAAGKIDAASCRAAKLTRKVLNFARNKADEISNVNLHELVTDLSRLLEPLVARRATIEIAQTTGPVLVRGNRSAIEQAIMNLVLNAVDSMPSGGRVRIDFAVREEVTGAKYAGLSVTDEGAGIASDDQGRVFEPFFTTKNHGTGMGLAIVDRIAKSHGGTVDFECMPGRGTQFRLWLPKGDSLQATEKAVAPAAPDVSMAGRTVLLVEDDPGILALTCQLLEADGLRVICATTAEGALAMFEKNREKVALLFTDIVLPGEISGRDLALKIFAQNPDLPVLYTSGNSNLGSDQSYLTAENFLPKPFPPGTMRNAVRLALART
jgi:two-component system cell cycle sensor histidine kinase/response regulator CckA